VDPEPATARDALRVVVTGADLGRAGTTGLELAARGMAVELVPGREVCARLGGADPPDGVVVGVDGRPELARRLSEQLADDAALDGVHLVVAAGEAEAVVGVELWNGAYVVEPDPQARGELAALVLRVLAA
jgi:hypothetical protein